MVEQEHIQRESFFFNQAQETVSKHYKERAFCKAPSMSMDGGFIKVRFCPWQRSLFLPPAKYQGKRASANREASQTQQACDWLMWEFTLSLEFHTFQARIQTGFHRFTKIGQSFYKAINFSWKKLSKLKSVQYPDWMTQKTRKGDFRE